MRLREKAAQTPRHCPFVHGCARQGATERLSHEWCNHDWMRVLNGRVQS
jgi:hypothetical protein